MDKPLIIVIIIINNNNANNNVLISLRNTAGIILNTISVQYCVLEGDYVFANLAVDFTKRFPPFFSPTQNRSKP